MLQIQNASVIFEGSGGRLVHALDRVSVDVAPNSIVVALGASGCGKSTLLGAVAGFTPLSDGAILLDGTAVAGPGADRGVVFQRDTLLPWRGVADNVALGLDTPAFPAAPGGDAPKSCSASCSSTASPTRSRTSCRAACASASASPARSPPIPRCC